MFEGLTNKGKAHIAKCLAENKPISFVKVKIGDGTLGSGENPETFTDIKSLKKEVSIADKTQEGETVRLLVQIDNTGLETGYFPREIGIYVQDGNQEILYWYINDGTETSWLPPASKSPVKFKYWINLLATNLDTVIVNWSGKELWVDREFLNQELIKKVDKTTTVTGVGALNGGGNLNKNISISHKDEKGFKHIPLGGALKNILKWGSDGIAKWGNLLWEEIDGKPTAMKNPKPLKIKTNGALKTEYIGDTEKELNITSADTGGLMRGALPNYINDENSIFNIISNNGGLDFDSNLLFLNDSGMKQVNKTYLDKNKKGIFKCIKQTAGVVNSTEFFVDISNNASSDKLENLKGNYKRAYLNIGEYLIINAELSYDQLLITASHDAHQPDFVAIISGSVSYTGVNFLSLYNSGDVKVTNISKVNYPIKIHNNASYQLEFKFTPLGAENGYGYVIEKI